jgi:hypothetical protein
LQGGSHFPLVQVLEQHSPAVVQVSPSLRQSLQSPATQFSPAQQPSPHAWPTFWQAVHLFSAQLPLQHSAYPEQVAPPCLQVQLRVCVSHQPLGALQAPHEPPQPSSPHCLPLH